ncbi:MAG: hypothetical protein M5U08_14190 [Burkholderiales bacterium]|nr:hypothetical protein [Burkholderiales bacterium]
MALRLERGGRLTLGFLTLGLARGLETGGLLTLRLLARRLERGGRLTRGFLALGLARDCDAIRLLTSNLLPRRLLRRSQALNGSLLRLRDGSLLHSITGIARRGRNGLCAGYARRSGDARRWRRRSGGTTNSAALVGSTSMTGGSGN